MSESVPTVPVINPAILEQWNRIGEDTPVTPTLAKQEWDVLLAALLDLNAATGALAAFALSDGPGKDWAAFQTYSGAQANARTRIIRFIETFMIRGSHGQR